MILDQQLDSLHPEFRPLAEKVLQICMDLAAMSPAKNIEVKLVATWRNPETQWELYRKGRVKNNVSGKWEVQDGSKIVTWAPPDRSPHCKMSSGKPASCAIDIAFINEFGWLKDRDPTWGIIPAACAIVDPLKLKSGAFFGKLRDWPHVELIGWETK